MSDITPFLKSIFECDPLATLALVVVCIGLLGLLYLAPDLLSSGNVELVTKIVVTLKDSVFLVLGFYFGRSRQEI